MKLVQFGYSESDSTDHEWVLEPFPIGKITLLVGQNATGKTRTINVITGLAKMLLDGSPLDGSFFAKFDSGLTYSVKVVDKGVISEELRNDGGPLLERVNDGTGWLQGKAVPRLDFGLAPNQLAAFAKRDRVQHDYLEPLFDWADRFRVYRFGQSMGRENFVVRAKKEGARDIEPRDTNLVLPMFERALRKDRNFGKQIAEDLNRIGYAVEEVRLEQVEVETEVPLPGPVLGISVKEKDLPAHTLQISISQGMFRAIAILIHIDYLLKTPGPVTIALDDIGEGLDFDRATLLIKLIIEKVEAGDAQILMSTNDRYVMNSVPLKYWGVIVRDGGRCKVLNYQNSQKVMDEFEYTGLSNFDFLRYRYWNKTDDETTSGAES